MPPGLDARGVHLHGLSKRYTGDPQRRGGGLLADRVVVMTGGPNHGTPGHIAGVVPVDIDHPRDTTSPAFNAIKRRLLELIHGDSPDEL